MERFGAYDLIERIGVGSLGEVFRAVHRKSGRLVALKRLSQRASDTHEVVEALEAEAKHTKELDHPNVEKLVEIGDVDGIHFIAFEFLAGRDLRALEDAAKKKTKPGEAPIPLDVAIFVALRIADALEHAHQKKLVHRDVSPTNILVGFGGEVKLLDFGIARAEGQAVTTKAGEVKGTVGYMSPEQMEGKIVDQRSDVYSLGACLWEICTGERLFQGPSQREVLKRASQAEIPNPGEVRALPSELTRILVKALARSPSERYSTAERLRADLSGFARGAGLHADTTRVADFVRSVFPEAQEQARREGSESVREIAHATRVSLGEPFAGDDPRKRSKEQQNMSESKGGSDLDVFEGLAKKPTRPAGGIAPPPPPAPPTRKGTLVGLSGLPPIAPPTQPSAAPPPIAPPTPSASTSAAPAPLPPPSIPPKSELKPPSPPTKSGIGVLPPVSTPPPKPPEGSSASSSSSGSTAPGALPPPMPPPSKAAGALPPPAAPPKTPLPPPPTITPLPPPPANASASPPAVLPPPTPPPSPSIGSQLGVPEKKKGKGKSGAAVDMDWDDEEESTHVYDKESATPMPSGPRPAAGTPAAPKVSAAAALLSASGKAAPLATQNSPSSPPLVGANGTQSLPAAQLNEPTAIRARPIAPSLPPAAGSSKLGVILGGVALVFVVALVVFTFIPKKGQFKIEIKTKSGGPIARAEIYIDGRKYCDTAPCVVPDLDPGPKTIKVIAPDYPVADPVTETVEAGKEKVVFLSLGDAMATPAGTNVVASTSAGGTGIRAEGAQPGVHVWVDGVDKGALPADIHDISAGSHKVKFDGGEHYERAEQTVDVTAGQVKDLGTIKLKVIKGQVTLDLVSTGATVELVRQAGAKKIEKKLPDSLWKSPPVRVDIDPSENWQLVATKKGFDDFKQDLSFDDGIAEKTIRIELLETGKAQGLVASNTSPNLASNPGPTPHETPAPKETTDKTPPKNEESSQASGTGTLNINSIPVSKVVLDGKPLGDTPKVGVSVSAGSHTVVFIHPDLGKKSVSVNVKAGETKTAAVKFKAPE